MYMTKREKELTAAQEQGKRDCCNSYSTCPDFDGDKAKQDAWKQGWKIQDEEDTFWHRRGYY